MRRPPPRPQLRKYDMILLKQVRNHFWHKMNSTQRAQWSAFWGQAKTYGAMTLKSVKKLEDMITSFSLENSAKDK